MNARRPSVIARVPSPLAGNAHKGRCLAGLAESGTETRKRWVSICERCRLSAHLEPQSGRAPHFRVAWNRRFGRIWPSWKLEAFWLRFFIYRVVCKGPRQELPELSLHRSSRNGWHKSDAQTVRPERG